MSKGHRLSIVLSSYACGEYVLWFFLRAFDIEKVSYRRKKDVTSVPAAGYKKIAGFKGLTRYARKNVGLTIF